MDQTAKPSYGRIYFKGNPWPAGHRIAVFKWTGYFEPRTGLWFGFELTSAEYGEEGPPPNFDESEAADPDDDWMNCWYENQCLLTPADGERGGFLVGTPQEPLSFASLTKREFRVDALPLEGPAAFHAYVSDPAGHTPIGDHRIRFVERLDGPFEFSVNWRGLVATSARRDAEIDCEFEARIERARFGGFHGVVESLQQPGLIERALQCLAEPELFEVTSEGCFRSLVPRQ
jgi:hypothetical protein